MAEQLLIHLRRALRRHKGAGARPTRRRLSPARRAILLGVLIAGGIVCMLEFRLRPVAQALAAYQINHRITARVNDSLRLFSADCEGLIEIHRNGDGAITALTADMAQANRIRAAATDTVLDAVAGIDVYELGIPLGSLLDFDLLWAKGPVVRVRELTAGTVDARLNSEFRSAGINQTLHRILLDVRVPVSILLPGGRIRTEVSTSVCLAETLIVGQVPQAYFSFETKERGNEYGLHPGDPAAASGAGAGGI